MNRPAAWFGLLLDGAFAVASYLAAYWLRFSDSRLDVFLPGALSTTPVVVACQLAALVVLGGYAARPRIDWLRRLAGGILAGTAAAAGILTITTGLEGLSRIAFMADAVLLSTAAIGWRGLWVLRARARAAERRGTGELVDRFGDRTLTAVASSVYRYRELLKNLVIKDLKLKYRGSVFGFLWSLANPLLMMVVYTIAFTYILRVRSEGFVFSLMLGLLSWTFFSSSAAMSTGAIVENAGLLKSVVFPRAILPIGTVLFNLAQYTLTMAVFLPALMLLYRVPPSSPMLLFPIFLGLQVMLTIGVALFLATATAFFRDVRHLLEVVLSVMFWTTPIVYELRQVPDRLQLPILLSPVSPFVVAYQEIFFYRQWPDPAVWVMAIVHAVGAFATGALVFVSFEEQFTEQL